MSNFVPRCYIAGPMTGYPEHNYPAFHKAAAEMRALGWEVINPAENHGGNTTLPREDYFRTDIPQLVSCDAVLLLRGWEQSRGARLEFAVARECGVRTLSSYQKPVQALAFEDEAWYAPAIKLKDSQTMGGPQVKWDSWPREEREKAAMARLSITPGELLSWYTNAGTEDPLIRVAVFGDRNLDPFSALLDQIRTLHDKKKQDYTGGEHPLANYKNSGESIGVSAVASMFSRMNEKVFRLKQLHKTGAAPQNESVIDSYMDVAILSLLSILALTPGSGYEEAKVA